MFCFALPAAVDSFSIARGPRGRQWQRRLGKGVGGEAETVARSSASPGWQGQLANINLILSQVDGEMARVKCGACKSAQSLKEKRERQAASEGNVVDVLAPG